MKVKDKIVRNFLFTGTSSIITAIAGFLLIPFLISRIGGVEYGLLSLIKTFAVGGLIGLFDLGFQQIISKHIAEYNSKQEKDNINKVIVSSFYLFLFLGCLLAVLGILLAPVISREVFSLISAEYKDSFTRAISIYFISYIFQFPSIVLIGILEGFQKFHVVKPLQSGIILLNTIVSIILVLFGHEYFSLNIANIVILLIQFIVLFLLVKKAIPFLSLSFFNFSFQTLKEMFKMARLTISNKLSAILSNQIEKLLIGILLGPQYVTSYDILTKLPRFLKIIYASISTVIMPASSELYAQKENEKLNKLYINSLKYTLFIAIPISTAFIFFTSYFLRFWVGDQYVSITNIHCIMLIWSCLTPFDGIGWSMLFGMKKKLLTRAILSWVNVISKNIVLFLFLKELQLAAIPAAYIAGFITLPYSVCVLFKVFDVKFVQFVKNIVTIIVISIIPFMSFYFFNFEYSNLFVMLVAVGIWISMYWILIFFIVFNKKDRQFFLGYINKIFGKFKSKR